MRLKILIIFLFSIDLLTIIGCSRFFVRYGEKYCGEIANFTNGLASLNVILPSSPSGWFLKMALNDDAYINTNIKCFIKNISPNTLTFSRFPGTPQTFPQRLREGEQSLLVEGKIAEIRDTFLHVHYSKEKYNFIIIIQIPETDTNSAGVGTMLKLFISAYYEDGV